MCKNQRTNDESHAFGENIVLSVEEARERSKNYINKSHYYVHPQKNADVSKTDNNSSIKHLNVLEDISKNVTSSINKHSVTNNSNTSLTGNDFVEHESVKPKNDKVKAADLSELEHEELTDNAAVKKIITKDGEILYKKRKKHMRHGSVYVPFKEAGLKSKSGIAHKKLPKPLFILIIFLICLLILFAGLFFLNKYGDMLMHQQGNQERIIEYKGKKYVYNDHMTSIMFAGYDAAPDRDDIVQADLVTCIAMDTSNGKSTVIAVPRDAMVDVSMAPDYQKGSSVYMQICNAFAFGNTRQANSENTRTVLSHTLMNIPIQSYFSLNMQGVAPLNDMVGGVTLVALDTIPSAGCVKGKTVTLHGDQALAYVQSRPYDATGADTRLNRQIQYMQAFAVQAIQTGKGDPRVFVNMFQEGTKYSTTDLGIAKVFYLATVIINNGVKDLQTKKLDATITEDSKGYAQYYLNEDNIKQTIIDTYYLPYESAENK